MHNIISVFVVTHSICCRNRLIYMQHIGNEMAYNEKYLAMEYQIIN